VYNIRCDTLEYESVTSEDFFNHLRNEETGWLARWYNPSYKAFEFFYKIFLDSEKIKHLCAYHHALYMRSARAKILFAVLLMIAFSIVILLWFFSWEARILVTIVSAYLLFLVPIVIALLIAKYAERRKKRAQIVND
jgi:hypothetical protein